MPRNVCSPLKPIASYVLTRKEGGYQVVRSTLEDQHDPYKHKVVHWVGHLSHEDYRREQSHTAGTTAVEREESRYSETHTKPNEATPAAEPGMTRTGSRDHYGDVERCLARANGVLLDIRRRFEKENTDQVGKIYTFDVTVYRWPKLGWAWAFCLALVVLAIAAHSLFGLLVKLRLSAQISQSPEEQPSNEYKQLKQEYDKLKQDYDNLSKLYRQTSNVAAELSKTLRDAEEYGKHLTGKKNDRISVSITYEADRVSSPKPRTSAGGPSGSGKITYQPDPLRFPPEDWIKFCTFLEECAKNFAANPD
jgi:hypothetical protein